MSHKTRRYVVGIDLGTTNTAVAYADIEAPAPEVRVLPILQLVAEGEVAERPTLPSYLYLGGGPELPISAFALPWDRDRNYAVGEFARQQGARVPSRLVASAKSWLCHGGVDRSARILPWGAPVEVPKVSPVEASARYLQHVREVWNRSFPHAPLDDQQVVLTVPASFDEVARELTWRAAQEAGLQHVVLLEEPQAALYAWLDVHRHDRDTILQQLRSILVVDVGGGTTDFSLVAVRAIHGRVALQRVAVGDHILLGGDNMDMAIARKLEHSWGQQLDTQRFYSLVQQCRSAKETLLSPGAPSSYVVSLMGRGRGVISGALSSTLEREQVVRELLEGFFPAVPFDSEPLRETGLAVAEWGLPFAADAAVSRHLAAFLRRHCGDGTDVAWPDAILFNGGALKPQVTRDRIAQLLSTWSGRPVSTLESVDLDLAVARGAAYFGLARTGRGIRIGGGAARNYYVGIDTRGAAGGQVQALCVVHRGMDEGEEREFSEVPLAVVTNQAVSFPLYASSVRTEDRCGSIVSLRREEVSALPAIRTVLRFGKKLKARELPVHVGVRLTEVGTLELWCVSRTTPHRWRLQFDLRDANLSGGEQPKEQAEFSLAAEHAEAALSLLRSVFPQQGSATGDPIGVVRELEQVLAAGKDAWPLAFLRQAWEVLWEGREARKLSPQHEARWYNLAGFFLRPGFGASGDPVRVDRLWRLRSEGIRFAKAVQVRTEWWTLWKRIAGGLQRAQQQQLFQEVAPHLLPRLQRKREKGPKAGPQELREFWQLVASCELLSAEQKAELGDVLLSHVLKGKATALEVWALGRLGARAPMYGPLNCVVPAAKVAEWVERIVGGTWERPEAVVFALVQLARCVGDRERDLPAEVRERVARRLETEGAYTWAIRLIREPHSIEVAERARILDEVLPAGLVWSAEPLPSS
ncbi:MAG: hsp70 family protein [Candidatus Binatia bacterium]|nr:hsp70 family protein [Candidatus Binatia bacterium]